MDIKLERLIDNRYSLIFIEGLNHLNAGVFLPGGQRLVSQVDARYLVSRTFQCSFNSYWEVRSCRGIYRPGKFVVHLAGHNFDPLAYKDWNPSRHFNNPIKY
ncbi:hypothetical protein BGZ95_001236 [Linnemannia exigua]|uniref:Uncharacterized protein n=1 Tax=Linnemannia exigua TaxID=604196 RepID=A0AAD4H533_9FUNG|nr:hypothetical protein BGZ95_001236 [Linnemannia exigua]